jgi:hypothetical protein
MPYADPERRRICQQMSSLRHYQANKPNYNAERKRARQAGYDRRDDLLDESMNRWVAPGEFTAPYGFSPGNEKIAHESCLRTIPWVLDIGAFLDGPPFDPSATEQIEKFRDAMKRFPKHNRARFQQKLTAELLIVKLTAEGVKTWTRHN